jgi:hypothetical protein
MGMTLPLYVHLKHFIFRKACPSVRIYVSSFAALRVTGFQDLCCGHIPLVPLQVGLFVHVRHLSVAAEIETQTGRECDSNPENGFDQNAY